MSLARPVEGKWPYWVGDAATPDPSPPDTQVLSVSKVSAPQLAGLRELGELRALSINASDLRGDALAALADLPLEWLRLYECQVDAGTAEHVAACSGLRALAAIGSLKVSDSSFNDDDLARFAGLEQLEILELVGHDGVEGKKVAKLAACAKLQALIVRDSHARPKLDKLTGLRTVLLDANLSIASSRKKARVGDSTLKQALALPELRTLSVGSCTKVSDKGIQALAEHPQLRHLRLARCGKTPTTAGVSALVSFAALEVLDFHEVPVDRERLDLLGQSKTLRALRIDVSRLGAGDLAAVSGLTTLEHLHLTSYKPQASTLTAADIEGLAPLGLRSLYLPQTLIVDEAMVEALAKLGVESLTIASNKPAQPPISAELLAPLAGTGIRYLAAAMPSVDTSTMGRAEANALTRDEYYPGRRAIIELLDGAEVQPGPGYETERPEWPCVQGLSFSYLE